MKRQTILVIIFSLSFCGISWGTTWNSAVPNLGTPAETSDYIFTYDDSAAATGGGAGIRFNGNPATFLDGTGVLSVPPITSVFGRTGDITAQASDYADYYLALSSCTSDGQIPVWNATTLAWECGTPTGTGDITGVIAGTGLSGGGLSGDVTLNLADTAVTPGTYTLATITVDQQGRVTAASSGTAGSGDLVSTNNLSDVADTTVSFDNIKQAATDAYTGVIELATDAEAVTGTDTTRAVTPANLTARLADAGAVTGTVATFDTYSTSSADGERYQLIWNTDDPTTVCDATTNGAFAYRRSDGTFRYCDGTNWTAWPNGASASTDLTDFSTTEPTATGQVPTWNASTNQYEPGTPSGGSAVVETSTGVAPTAGEYSADTWIFDSVLGNGYYQSSSGLYTFTGTYVANPAFWSLTISPAPTNGTITESTKINCGSGGTDCTDTYAEGNVTLTATPDSGYEVGTWSGTNLTDNGDGTATINLTQDISDVTVTFDTYVATKLEWSMSSDTVEKPTGKTAVRTGNGAYISTGCYLGDCYDNVDTTSYVSTPVSSDDIIDPNNFTITLYVNPQVLNDYGTIFSVGSDSDNEHRVHVYSSGAVYMRTVLSGTQYYGYVGSVTLSVGTWYKIEYSYTSNTISISIDNVLESTTATTTSFTGTPAAVIIGDATNLHAQIDALFDEITIK